ncbi:MAG: 3-dehydroquinate synthase [Pseudomonadota bacterium]|nr:3-dehydroquinate synthase [Pseudomonadota bacterium]
MLNLNVDLGQRSYPIIIGSDILHHAGLLDPYINDRDTFIVSNGSIAPLYLSTLKELINSKRIESLILPEGERTKSVSTLENIYDALAEKRLGRDCVLIALGGGVIGDVAGLAAATWQRGIDFIQVPTTLLAQVDSSVGGKTAVNHSSGKNLIGVFHQPICVLSDIKTLNTLPEREFSAGLAEVVKYGLLADQEFFEWLESEYLLILNRESNHLEYLLERSCSIKARLVSGDEREHSVRALLNLGHTFGHALERCLGYGEWLHGEAVASGISMAAELSLRMNWLNDSDVSRIRTLLMNFNLPVDPPKIELKKFVDAMAYDKKIISNKTRLILLESIGSAIIVDDYPENHLSKLLEEYFAK